MCVQFHSDCRRISLHFTRTHARAECVQIRPSDRIQCRHSDSDLCDNRAQTEVPLALISPSIVLLSVGIVEGFLKRR